MNITELGKSFDQLTTELYRDSLSFNKDRSDYNKHKLLNKIDEVNSFRNKLSRDELNFLRLCALNDAYKNPTIAELSKIVKK